MNSSIRAFGLLAVLILAAGNAAAQAVLSTGLVAAEPGTTVWVPITISANTNASSFQCDLVFETNYLSTGIGTAGPANSGAFIFTNVVFSPGIVRVLSVGFTVLPDGVVALVPFTVATNTPDHNETLLVSNVVMSSAIGDNVAAVGSTNVFEFLVPPRFASISVIGGAGAELTLAGATGRTYVIQAASDAVLAAWVPISTNTSTDGTVSFEDMTAANYPARFYRAIVLP